MVFLSAQNAPEIKFASVSNAGPTAWTEELKISISYFDADGDLGENANGIENLFVSDSRNQIQYPYRIRKLLADDKQGSIKGLIELIIDYVPVINPNLPFEEVVYSVWVIDRKGLKSNTVETMKLKVLNERK